MFQKPTLGLVSLSLTAYGSGCSSQHHACHTGCHSPHHDDKWLPSETVNKLPTKCLLLLELLRSWCIFTAVEQWPRQLMHMDSWRPEVSIRFLYLLLSTIFLAQGLPFNLEPTSSARLTGQWVPEICLSLPTLHQIANVYHGVTEHPHSGSNACTTKSTRTEPLPQSHYCI